MADRLPRIVVKLDDEGCFDGVLIEGAAEVFVIDESSPNDRVYKHTTQARPGSIAALIGDSEIGSRFDDIGRALSGEEGGHA